MEVVLLAPAGELAETRAAAVLCFVRITCTTVTRGGNLFISTPRRSALVTNEKFLGEISSDEKNRKPNVFLNPWLGT